MIEKYQSLQKKNYQSW